jgi:hypothetical protein
MKKNMELLDHPTASLVSLRIDKTNSRLVRVAISVDATYFHPAY